MSGALAQVRSVDRVTWAVIAVALVAFVTRTAGLDVRALHHDESLHATYSWYLAEGRGYRHDPLMHGPFQFHIMALFYVIFGDSDAVSRWPHAIFGTALVCTPLLLRRWLGGTGTVLAALFLAVSPSLLYFSRFAREDTFIALFTVLQFIAVWRYRDDGRERWLLLLAAATAFAFATKESAYLTAAVLLLYLNAATAHELFWQSRRGKTVPLTTQALHGAWLIPTAWVIAALWPLLRSFRERAGFLVRPREADLLVVTGTLVLPLLAAALHPVLEAAYQELDPSALRVAGTATVLVLLIWAAAVGLMWDARRWPLVMAAFLLVTVPLFTTFGTNPEGIAGPFWTSLDYWIDQHDVRRGEQPGFYYLMLLPLYESLVLWPALVAGPWLVLRRRDAFATLLVVWFAGTVLALSLAGEKMPWLLVHLTIPLTFLAAYALGRLAERAAAAVRERRGSTLRWAAGGALASGIGMLFALAVHADIGLNVRHPDTPVEPLIYVQTSPDVPRLAGEIKDALARGEATRVVIDTSSSITWPWAWYLRGEPVTYLSGPEVRDAVLLLQGDLLIAASTTLSDTAPLRGMYEPAIGYVHRHWFVEAGYRETSFGSFAEGLRDGSMWRRWSHFLVHRGSLDEIGQLRGEVFMPIADASP